MGAFEKRCYRWHCTVTDERNGIVYGPYIIVAGDRVRAIAQAQFQSGVWARFARVSAVRVG
jgi:hypothetical protein